MVFRPGHPRSLPSTRKRRRLVASLFPRTAVFSASPAMQSAAWPPCRSSRATASIWPTPARVCKRSITIAGCATPCASIPRPRCRFTSTRKEKVRSLITTRAMRKSRLKPSGNTSDSETKCRRRKRSKADQKRTRRSFSSSKCLESDEDEDENEDENEDDDEDE